MILNDTICALATPPGLGGLAVIRLSGEEAFSIADTCFQGKTALIDAPSHTIHYGKIVDEKRLIDTVTASVFRSPNSYTGENVVEIGCHGGMLVSQQLVALFIRHGARPATAGEFTKRAFLNKKLDLTQVEAVADIIHAVSLPGSHAAAKQLSGGLTNRLQELRQQLIEACGLLELELDFSEEDLEFVDKAEFRRRLESSMEFCRSLLESFTSSEILRSGFHVGLAGFPNAGKSSLLNALLQKQRAIVSDIPGTTRDYIEETIHLHGIAIKLYDTAGLRDAQDAIEIEGIQLAESLLKECHLICIINDISTGIHHSDSMLKHLKAQFPNTQFLLIQNKADLHGNGEQQEYDHQYHDETLTISAKQGHGITQLKDLLYQKAQHNTQRVNDALINTRHAHLLEQVLEALTRAIDAIEVAPSNEFIAIDVRDALKRIGEITGEVWSEDVLNDVFSKFCIGK